MRVCICGHDEDCHNHITSRCCYGVEVGWLAGELDSDPIIRRCDLCPPTGFVDKAGSGSERPFRWPVPLSEFSDRDFWMPLP